jgi:8-amino-7-oxononanoate synthase
MTGDTELAAELAALDDRRLRRVRRTIAGAQGAEVIVEGRRVLCLASNNYLGLAGDPDTIRAAGCALEASGIGAAASPLVSGHMRDHAALESAVASWLGCEAALLFGSGYHANIAVLPAIAGTDDEIFSDELNHASLIDGCRLARARVTVFPHRDMAALEGALGRSRARRKLIVSDSIFSMDGDAAPIADIVRLAERYGAWTMLDEAHAVGVCGPTGAGHAEAEGFGDRITIRMGTLSKALGSYGAFVAGSRPLIETLLNRGRAYVFSTALPPPVVAAAMAAIGIVRREPARRERLWQNARRLHDSLTAGGIEMRPLESPILPLVIGESAAALEVASSALGRDVLAPAIRPPTVPTGTARLRLTPIATHSDEQLDRAAEVLIEAVREAR